MHPVLKMCRNWRPSIACLTFALAIFAITTIVAARNLRGIPPENHISSVGAIQPLALTVNAPGDSPDLTLNGICDTGAAPTQQCTLRAAIQEANNSAGDDTISFNLPSGSVIEHITPLAPIGGNLTITGPGATFLTIARTSSTPDFGIFAISPGQTVVISGLTLTNGDRNTGNFPDNTGGGIHNEGNLTISDMIIRNNHANTAGGGLSNNGGIVTINDSTITGNNSSDSGAGIYNDGTMTINRSTVSGNTNGGGIDNNDGVLTINNCTISTNSNLGTGGGVLSRGTSSNVTIRNSTITGNQTNVGLGGGLAQLSNSITLHNSIVFGNVRTASSSVDNMSGTVAPSSSFNLIGTGPVGGMFNGVNNNIVGVVDAKLGPLANNGGSTETHALLAGSLALDAGSNAVATNAGLSTDQRGFNRTRDAGDPDTTQTVDIGAYEADPAVEDIPNKATPIDIPLPTFIFHIGDSTTAFDSITATSSNQALVPNANVVLGADTPATRTLSLTPLPGAAGSTTITVVVTKTISANVRSMTDTFVLSVSNNPTTTGLADVNVEEDAFNTPISLTTAFNDAEDGPTGLVHSIQENTNPGLFNFTNIENGVLILDYAPNAVGTANITIRATDSGGLFAEDTFTVNVAAVNDAPIFQISGDPPTLPEDSGAKVIPGFASNFRPGPTSAIDESTQTLVGYTVTVIGTTGNLVFASTPTVDLAGTLQYQPQPDTSGTASLRVVATDSGSGTPPNQNFSIRLFTITITAVNDGPVNTVPSTQSVVENGTLIFSAANSNLISVNDLDAGGNPIQVSLTANGTLTLNSTVGLTFNAGDGVNDPSMRFSGLVSNINNALNGLTFEPDPGFSGAASLLILTNDLGNSGSGGARMDIDTININVLDGGDLVFSSASYSHNEGGGVATITVNRTGGTNGEARVSYATTDGTATGGGTDYTTVTGLLSFSNGVTSQTFTVPVNNDNLDESNETVNLTLSNAQGSGALGSPATAILTITDDDPQNGTIQFSAPTYTVNENGGSVTITINRTGTTTNPTTVDYATSDMTANERSDYTTATGRLRFATGETSASFVVMVNTDSYAEGPELVGLTLSTPGFGAELGAQQTATLQINNVSTSLPNTNDDAELFVIQHYHDFLNREPDNAGRTFWTNEIASCGADATCIEVKRINVSAAFFLSIEFQVTGVTAFLTHAAAFGPTTLPAYQTFVRDTQALQRGYIFTDPGSAAVLEANKVVFFNEFVDRLAFQNIYGGLLPAQYVDALIANTSVTFTPDERAELVNGLDTFTETRATVLRKITEKAAFKTAQFNRQFVYMQYVGYLRRHPADAPDSSLDGFNFWLNKLIQFNGNFVDAEMVKGFLRSTEYRLRFGP